jgi:hypothetical protein
LIFEVFWFHVFFPGVFYDQTNDFDAVQHGFSMVFYDFLRFVYGFLRLLNIWVTPQQRKLTEADSVCGLMAYYN